MREVALSEWEYGVSTILTPTLVKWVARDFVFADKELDFIINYDIRYRMGREEESAEE